MIDFANKLQIHYNIYTLILQLLELVMRLVHKYGLGEKNICTFMHATVTILLTKTTAAAV